jgi:hypothetical protein
MPSLADLRAVCQAATPPERWWTCKIIASGDGHFWSCGSVSISQQQAEADAHLIYAMRTHFGALLDVVGAVMSVCSEPGVREELCSYVMGVELLDQLAALEKKP